MNEFTKEYITINISTEIFQKIPHVATVLMGSPSIDPFLSLAALNSPYEVTISLRAHAVKFDIYWKTTRYTPPCHHLSITFSYKGRDFSTDRNIASVDHS